MQYGGSLPDTNGRNVAAVFKEGHTFCKKHGAQFMCVCGACASDVIWC